MAKKITKPIGDKLFVKTNITSPWEPARFSDLKSLLSERETPYSSKEKLNLPQFGFGRFEGKTENTQTYPTRYIVVELDTPSPHKGKLSTDEELFEEWSNKFKSIFLNIRKDDTIRYQVMYLTPSMCGLRFIAKFQKLLKTQKEYEHAVLSFLGKLKKHGVKKEYYDVKVNCGWFLPTFEQYYNRRSKIFDFEEEINTGQNDKKLNLLINKAISLTEDVKVFESGNRNEFIYLLGRNANRLGIDKTDLLDHISGSDFAFDMKEINTTIDSAYKRVEDFGIWTEKSDIVIATVSLMSLFKRAKNMKPIPIIWSGIKKGSLGFIFGPAKSGKSTLCESLGMSLAGGLDQFFGLPLQCKQHKVLYISLEEYWENRIERNRQQRRFLFKSFKKKLGSNYFTNNENYPTVVVNDKDLKFIEIEINKCEPDIVFIDSFTRLMIDKIEDSTKTNSTMLKLKKMCNDTGATFVLIHHTTKAKDKSLSITNMAGSRVLSQEADFLIGVNMSADGQRYLKDIAFRYARENEKVIPFEINDDRWVIASEPVYESKLFGASDGRKDDTNKQAILDYIKSVEDTVSIADIKEHFNNDMSKKTLYNNLNKLVAEGKIEKVEKGVYKCSVDKSNK